MTLEYYSGSFNLWFYFNWEYFMLTVYYQGCADGLNTLSFILLLMTVKIIAWRSSWKCRKCVDSQHLGIVDTDPVLRSTIDHAADNEPSAGDAINNVRADPDTQLKHSHCCLEQSFCLFEFNYVGCVTIYQVGQG